MRLLLVLLELIVFSSFVLSRSAGKSFIFHFNKRQYGKSKNDISGERRRSRQLAICELFFLIEIEIYFLFYFSPGSRWCPSVYMGHLCLLDNCCSGDIQDDGNRWGVRVMRINWIVGKVGLTVKRFYLVIFIFLTRSDSANDMFVKAM